MSTHKDNIIRIPTGMPLRDRPHDGLCQLCVYIEFHTNAVYCFAQRKQQRLTPDNYNCVTYCSGYEKETLTIADLNVSE